MNKLLSFFILIGFGLTAKANPESVPLPKIPKPKKITYTLIHTYPHDTSAYTQGLSYADGKLIESTGRRGTSKLKWVEIQSGKALKEVNIPNEYFGEGSVKVENKIFVLTWHQQIGLIYHAETLELTTKFSFKSSQEGWGLTYDGKYLWRSDGTHHLWRINPQNFKEESAIEVRNHKGEVSNLNELEYINGKIFANVYTTNQIVVINPENGWIEAILDLKKLYPKTYFKTQQDDVWNNVLNGIAYNPENGHLYITGKKWPFLYEIAIQDY